MIVSPKILFTDIDGTLMNRQLRLPQDNIDAIKRLYQKLNIPVILVSARTPSSISLIQSELGIDSVRICYNGAVILAHNNDKIVEDWKLTGAECSEIIEQADLLNMHISIFLYDQWFANRNDEWVQKEILITRVKPNEYDIKPSWFTEKGAHKIMIMGDPTKIDRIENYMHRHHFGRINFYRTKPQYLEISSQKANKLSAIKKVLQLYGLQLKDAIAIGDSHNDRDMIKEAGIGAAVGNAPKEVREAADFIAPPELENGIAYIIKHFFG